MLKKIISLAAAFCMAWMLCMPAAALEIVPPEVTAGAYVVMDLSTGQVLIQKDSLTQRFPASITKIMTLALAMEKCGGDLSQQVTVSHEAVFSLESGSSHVALQPGEVISLMDAFYATVLMSANDAANVLAEYTAGSIDAFIALMNAKAQELGLLHTHFVNANGLHDSAHYTSAYDMAKITQWAMSVPGFSEMFGQYKYTMQPTNKQTQPRLFGTDNVMLVTSKYEYEGTTGGKSGWTPEAGYTMVETVTRDGRSLVCVVLGSSGKYEKFKDCIALLDYCFNNFTIVGIEGAAITAPKVPVYGGGEKTLGTVTVKPAEHYWFQLHNAYTTADVQWRLDMPQKYVLGAAFDASITLSLQNASSAMNTEIATFPMQVQGLSEILAANTQEVERIRAQQTFPRALKLVLWSVFGLFLAFAALVGGRIAYVAYVKAQRRKKRRLARTRAAYIPHGMPAPRRAQAPGNVVVRTSLTPRHRQNTAPQLRVLVGGKAGGQNGHAARNR